jgi:excinuclease UvrABC nuclease subunit
LETRKENLTRFTDFLAGANKRRRKMSQKTIKFNRTGASKLPVDKPVVYKIQTESGKTNYVGIAKRGRAQERIQEHLDAGKIPGAKVHIEQTTSIQEAQKKEQAIISKTKPKYNDQGE